MIVEGDHSCRIELWQGQPTWTEEDDQASHEGVFDPRPALLIHQAGQTQPKINGSAWPLIKVHEVAEQVVRGEAVHY